VGSLELVPEADIDAAGARQAVELLEADHGVDGVEAVVAVEAAEGIVQLAEPSLQQVDAPATRAGAERGREDDLLEGVAGREVAASRPDRGEGAV
jgi:hypothetical protein